MTLGAVVTLLGSCAPIQDQATPSGESRGPGNAGASTAARPAAAQPTAAQPTPAASSSVDSSSGAPSRGGVLRSVVIGDINGLEPHILLTTTTETLWMVYDRLTMYDDQLVPQPQLAESWETSADATQLRLNLRKGVQFHTGRELTSDDVKYNILRVRDPKVGAGQFALQSNWFTEIDTPDKYSVVLKSESPRPLVFDFFELFSIADKDTLQGADAASKAVGTGPFRFVEWAQGDHFEVARNQSYWEAGLPYLDGVRVRIGSDPQAMVAQLEAGSLDYFVRPPLTDFVRLRSDPRFQGPVHPNGGRFFAFGLNTLNPPLDNKQVRQAVNYAIDRKRFVDSVTSGIGKPQALPWLPGSPAYEPSKELAFGYDLAKARSLLDDAGVSNFSMDLLVRSGTVDANTMAQIWQADLAKIGITLNIKPLENAAWNDQVNNRKYMGAYYGSASKANLQPGTIYTSSTLFMPLQNNSGFKSEQYTTLVNQVAAEPDTDKRRTLYSTLNDLLLDESFTIAISPDTIMALTAGTLRGLTPRASGSFDVTAAWLSAAA